MKNDIFAIAIDGPASSGKSTIAKSISKKLGILYVDTGAMYRAVALFCIRKGISTTDEDAVNSVLDEIDMDIETIDGIQHIILNGEDVSDKIRTQEVGQGASDVAVFFNVRERLVEIQRNIAKEESVVMDGRDIGTNVLKDAQYKIYLTASLEERASRRYAEYVAAGENFTLEEVKAQLAIRDKNDMEREHNPLTKAEGALEIDSTNMSIEEVENAILDYVQK
ncbi:MAG: (d)CMP kinase [Firmicutes bacterium]|nr:(d)CMP kinase [Bacillota bacterium]